MSLGGLEIKRQPTHNHPTSSILPSSTFAGSASLTKNTVEMARRPARCYRYCKNKVSCPSLISEMTLHLCGVFQDVLLCLRRAHSGLFLLLYDGEKIYNTLTSSSHSHIPNPASTVVSPTPRSASSISVASVPMSTNSLSASIWSRTNMNSSPPKP